MINVWNIGADFRRELYAPLYTIKTPKKKTYYKYTLLREGTSLYKSFYSQI